jgi:DNA processing protein
MSLHTRNRTHETAALLALLRSQLVPSERLASLVEHVGSAVELVQQSETDRLFEYEQPVHTFIGKISPADIERALLDVEGWTAARYPFTTVLDDTYPTCLRTIYNRPTFLFSKGRFDESFDHKAIAVVGARAASENGRKRAAKLSRELVEAGFSIYSGLAVGIDTAAHEAALAVGGRTVAVLGTGIDLIYPQENDDLSQRILESGGALVSQFLPRQPPTKWTFPQRNVVMSGLTLGTVVVEASETSGARLQARVALQHARTVFLLRSLVDSYAWARKFVDEGVQGTRAIVIASTNELLDQITPEIPKRLTV